MWSAVRYVLGIRTNVIVMIANSVGNFFFAGLTTFAVVFVVGQYHLSTAAADLGLPIVGVGALAGTLGGGRIGDALQRRGVATGGLAVASVSYVVAAVVLVPATLTHSLMLALPLFFVGAAALTAPNPALDAVRLDVVAPRLRGRAEAVRTVLTTAAGALAPLLFGYLSAHLAGGGHRGLQLTFLVMLPALAANGLILLAARPSYPREVELAERGS